MTRSTVFKSILVPLDGSPFAEQALPLATQLAKRSGGKLRLALVHQPPPNPNHSTWAKKFRSVELATRKSEHAYLHGFADKLRSAGTDVTAAVTLSGPTGSTIADYVAEIGIDLVVMATHGRGGLQRAWLGSVADYLVRHLAVPVLLVRPAAKGAAPARESGNRQVVVPLDGSPLAEEVLESAAELAKAWDAEMTLLRIVHPIVLSEGTIPPTPSPYDEELTELSREQAQDYVRDLSERLREHGSRASGTAVVGWSTAATILSVSRPEQTLAIAIASHGRGGLRRLALGSVADKLVRGADVPVLVCHPTRTQKEKSKSSIGRDSEPRKMAAQKAG